MNWGAEHAISPWLLLVVAGFLPNELWRVLGVFAARRLSPDSELLAFIRGAANALLAGVCFKLLFTSTGVLAETPVIARAGAFALGVLTFHVSKRSALAAILAGEAAVVAATMFMK